MGKSFEVHAGQISYIVTLQIFFEKSWLPLVLMSMTLAFTVRELVVLQQQLMLWCLIGCLKGMGDGALSQPRMDM